MFVANSCNKENDSIQNQVTSHTGSRIAQQWGRHRQYYYTVQDCFSPGADCYDDIVVKGATLTAFNNLNDSISVGNTAVKNYFNGTDEGTLLPDFSGADLDSLQTGSFSLVVNVYGSSKEFISALPPAIYNDSLNLATSGGYVLVFDF